MKKAQLMGQPIIYIFFALVAAMILFFGIRVILNTQDAAEKVEFESFVNDLQRKVNTVYQDSYGSVISLNDIIVPKKITELWVTSISMGSSVQMESAGSPSTLQS